MTTRSRPACFGQAMVEFALVGPLFFLLVLMIVEGALLMNAQISLDNATREAARALSVCGSAPATFYYGSHRGTCPALTDAVAHASYGIVPASGPSIGKLIAPGFGTPGSVTLTYSYGFYALQYLGVSGPTIALQSTAPVIGQQ